MTKQDFVDAVAKRAEKMEISKTAVRDIVDMCFEEAAKAIKKDKRFSFPGFGTFTVKARKAREGRNPKTGEALKIKASKTVGFKPAPTLKEKL